MADAKFKLALPARGLGFAPIQYAVEEGLFQREGTPVEIVMLEGGPACASALLSSEIHLTCALGPLIRSAMGGSRGFKAISGLRKKLEFSIVGKPDLASLKDLRTKTIESPHGDWSGGTYLKYVLRKLGFEGKIQLDYNYVTQEQRLEGLLKGEFEAGLLAGEKVLLARERGFKVLVDFAEVLPDVSSAALATTPKLIQERTEELRHIIRAVKRAIDEIQGSGPQCVNFLVRYFSIPRKTAEDFYQLQACNFSIHLSPEGIQKEIDVSHEVHGLPRIRAEEIVDLTLLNEVLREN